MAERVSGRREERLFTSYSGRIANVMALGGFLTFLGRSVIPPLLPSIVEDLSLTTSQAGLVMTVLFLAYALLQYPGGRLSDRLSRKTLIVASLSVSVVGCVSLILARTHATLLVGVALLGAGQGVYIPTSRGLIADLFVDRRSAAFGIQVGANSAGSAVAAGLAVAVLSVATWQAAFVPTALGFAVVIVLIHQWSRERYHVERVTFAVGETFDRLFTTRRMLILLASYSLFAAVWVGTLSFLPSYLQAEKSMTVALSSTAYALFFVAGIVASPVAGQLGDRVPRLPLCAAMSGVTLVGIVVLLVGESLPVVLGGVAVLGAGCFSMPPVLQSVLMGLFPDDSLGGDFGALRTVYTGVGALGPAYVGFVAERESFGLALVTFIGCLAVAAIGFLVVDRMDL